MKTSQITENIPTTKENSAPRNQDKEALQCGHIKRISFGDRNYCLKCGVMKNAYKSNKFSFGVFFDPLCVRQSQQSQARRLSIDNPYIQHRNNVIDFIMEISSQLKFSFNTLHLSIAYMDSFMSKNTLPEEKLQLYAATSLMLASKTIELDMKIPFISKLKKFAKLENPTVDFKRAEQDLLKFFNWNLQQCTLIDHMETLLSLGVIFQTDTLCCNQPQNNNVRSPKKRNVQFTSLGDAKIYELCYKIEKDYLRVANLVVRESKFIQWSDRAKATASILYLRKLCGIHPIWYKYVVMLSPKQLTDVVNDKEDIVQLFEQIVINLDPIFITPVIPQYCSSSAVSPQRVPLGVSNLNKLEDRKTEEKKTEEKKNNLIQVFGPAVQQKNICKSMKYPLKTKK